MTLGAVAEGVVLAIILLVCLGLALRWALRQIRGNACAGTGCAGCSSNTGSGTSRGCPIQRVGHDLAEEYPTPDRGPSAPRQPDSARSGP